jgi:hypothetical protein
LRDPEPASDLAGCCVGAFPDCSLKLTILFVCLFDPFELRRESRRLGEKTPQKIDDALVREDRRRGGMVERRKSVA